MKREKQADIAPLSIWWLVACVAVYTTLTALLIFRVPLEAQQSQTAEGLRFLRTAPDESAHFEYIAYLAEKGALPVFKPLGANQPGYEFHQPPLYYALCAPAWKIFGGGATAKYFCRFVSLLCGAATLYLLWMSAAMLVPNRRELPLLATGFMALWPLHINVGAAAGPDALTDLWCSLLFFLIARGAVKHRNNQNWHWRDSLLCGAVLGLGLLTKNTPLVLAPMALIAAWILAKPTQSTAVRSSTRAISPLSSIAIFAAATLFLVGGWWARNTILYGDPLAMGIFNRAFSGTSPGPAAFLGSGVPLDVYLRAVLLVMFSTFWGFFGGPNTAVSVLNVFGKNGPAPAAFDALPLMLLCAAATLIALFGLVRAARSWAQLDFSTRAALGLWLGGAVLVGLAWLQFNLTYFQAQARYLHPAALPLALGFAIGWQTLARSSPRKTLWNWGAAIFALGLLALTLWNVVVWRTLV